MIIDQHYLEGVFAETEFRHQRPGKSEKRSDYVNSTIFNDLESFRILEEVNTQALNSFPIDILGLMDLPEINHDWYQFEFNKGFSDDTQAKSLTAEVMFQYNYKRYFNPIELLNGYQMLNRIGLQQYSEHGTVLPEDEQINRDPQKIVDIFTKLNHQQDDRRYDFKFVTNLMTPSFALTLIEKALVNDRKFGRFRNFRKTALIMDGKDVITSNMDLVPVIMQPF